MTQFIFIIRAPYDRSRILIIEDNPANPELMGYLLKAFGHTVLSATDGAEGLDIAGWKNLISLSVISTCPGWMATRWPTISRCTPSLSQIPLVAVTALAMPGDCEKVLGAGFDGYIDKPIVPEIFVKQCEAFMD